MVDTHVKLTVVYRWRHSTGIKKARCQMTCNLQRQSRAGWEKNNKVKHILWCVRSQCLFSVQAWVYVFTSSDICYLVSCSLFLFPSTGSFFIILTPFPLYFSPVFLLSFLIQFELVPKVCKLSQEDHPDAIMSPSKQTSWEHMCMCVPVSVDRRFKSTQWQRIFLSLWIWHRGVL